MPLDLSTLRKARRLKTSVAMPPSLVTEAKGVASSYGISLSEYLVRLLEADLRDRRAVYSKASSPMLR